jgi:NAD(P)-dependent dehydrogenase (short-subunit alcohol dehydrogenase family)
MEIKGVSAIVTGGASGIGAASVRLLAKGGAKVVIADLDRQQEVGEALAKEVGGAFCAVDVTNTDDIINAVEMAKSMGPLRVLINSAGIGWAQRTIGKDGQYESAANIEAFKKVIAINLVGTFDAIRIAATARRRAWSNRQYRIGCCIRRSDWPERILCFKGRRCWSYIASCS